MDKRLGSYLTHRDAATLAVASQVLTGESRKKGLARLWPFMGPAFIASIAHVDPGNFATNIQGGAKVPAQTCRPALLVPIR